MVLAALSLLHLIAQEITALFEHENNFEANKRAAMETTVQKWQLEWDNSQTRRWTSVARGEEYGKGSNR